MKAVHSEIAAFALGALGVLILVIFAFWTHPTQIDPPTHDCYFVRALPSGEYAVMSKWSDGDAWLITTDDTLEKAIETAKWLTETRKKDERLQQAIKDANATDIYLDEPSNEKE